MWVWFIVIAVVIGAAIAYFGGEGKKEDALEGAMAGGCMAGNCLFQLLLAGLSLLFIIWLFNLMFG